MNNYHDEQNELLIQLAKDFYLENIPVIEMAKKYELSRYKILKYLSEAKESGIVTINIRSPYERNYELENSLNQHFKTKLFILKDTEDLAHRDIHFWHFTAHCVQEFIQSANVVALSWGDSVYKVIEQFKPEIREKLIFTQFIGEIGKYQSLAGSMRLVQKAAMKYESKYLTLSAPLYIINCQARELLALEPILQKTLLTAAHSDIILSGIATPASITSVEAWNRNRHLLFGDHLAQACGLVYGRPFDQYGNFLNLENDPTFGLSLEQILDVPTRIGVSNSKFKAEAVLGALRGDFFTHFFIDEKSALKILSLLK